MDKKLTADSSLEDIDRRTVFHALTNLKQHAHGELDSPRIMVSGAGVRITDVHGRESLDAFSGLCCVNVGYGRAEIANAIYAQTKKLAYYHTYAGHSNEPVIRLSQEILEWAPAHMSKVYFGTSGSDANETQLKVVWYYNNVLGRPEKRKIISRIRGFHGSGIITGSMTGLPLFQKHFNLPMPDILHTVTPHFYHGAQEGMSELEFSSWCAEELEKLILAEGPEKVAAFIGEPVMGSGGIIPPPEGYWDKIQCVLKKYDVLLIADEVITAFGRLGFKFGSEAYGIKPDLITIAKGVTSGYQPLSGVIVSERVWAVLEQGCEQFGPFGHGWTYSGHATAAAAGCANLDILEKENLVENAAVVGTYFLNQLHEAFDDHPIVGEVRGIGLLAALEFVADKDAKEKFPPETSVGARISAACWENGIIARAMPHGDILGFAPPLILTKEDVDEIIIRTQKSLKKVYGELDSKYR